MQTAKKTIFILTLVAAALHRSQRPLAMTTAEMIQGLQLGDTRGLAAVVELPVRPAQPVEEVVVADERPAEITLNLRFGPELKPPSPRRSLKSWTNSLRP